MTPGTHGVLAACDGEHRSLGLVSRCSIEHPETISRSMRIRRLRGGGALEKVPSETIVAAIIILVVHRGLRVSEISLEIGLQPGFNRKRTVGIQCGIERNN